MSAVAEYGLQLSKPRIVMTHLGEKIVKSGFPTPEFWEAWRADKAAVKSAGFSVSKDPESGEWKVTKWESPLTREERSEARAMSATAEAADVVIPVPAGLSLLPYQSSGINYAMRREGCLIADEMGLGKTIQAIGVANATEAKRILVICPASLRLNWRKEIQKWQTRKTPVHVIRGGKDRFPDIRDGWLVINYDLIGKYQDELKREPWDLLIADEAHYMKNSKTQRTKFVLGGGRGEESSKPIPAKRRVLLTGTPITNRPSELYTLIHYLDPTRWSSFWSYAKRYCGAFSNGYGLQMGEAQNLDELQARLRETVMVRRLKKDVLTELPAKRRQVIALEPQDEETRRLIERERETEERNAALVAAAAAAAQRAEAEGDDAAYEAAVKRLKDVQAVAFAEMSKLRHEVAVAKVPAVIEHLQNTDGKVVVMCWHKDVAEALTDALADQGVVKLTGDTPLDERQWAVEKFQSDPHCRFFVGNIQAAGVGITLTASSHVVFAEIDWVPANLSQAEDRCHRIGQTDSVLVQHIVLDGSLDARMANTLIEKQEVIEKALDRETTVDMYGADYVAPVSAPQSGPSLGHAPQTATTPAPATDRRADARRAQTEAWATTATPDQIAAVHEALRILAAMDSDRARQLNAAGFSKTDTEFGCELAARQSLTPRQAAVGARMVRKYRKQYQVELYERIFLERWQ